MPSDPANSFRVSFQEHYVGRVIQINDFGDCFTGDGDRWSSSINNDLEYYSLRCDG